MYVFLSLGFLYPILAYLEHKFYEISKFCPLPDCVTYATVTHARPKQLSILFAENKGIVETSAIFMELQKSS